MAVRSSRAQPPARDRRSEPRCRACDLVTPLSWRLRRRERRIMVEVHPRRGGDLRRATGAHRGRVRGLLSECRRRGDRGQGTLAAGQWSKRSRSGYGAPQAGDDVAISGSSARAARGPGRLFDELPLSDRHAKPSPVPLGDPRDSRWGGRPLLVVVVLAVSTTWTRRSTTPIASARTHPSCEKTCASPCASISKSRGRPRLEGPDQRPPPGRVRDVNTGCTSRGACCSTCLDSGCRSGGVFSTDHSSVHLRHGLLGQSAHEPPRARSTASWVGASMRWASRTGRRRRPIAVDAVRAAAVLMHSPASTSTERRDPHTRGNGDCHVILRGGKEIPITRRGVADALSLLRAAGCHPAGDRRLTRQQRQGSEPPTARGGGRRDRLRRATARSSA